MRNNTRLLYNAMLAQIAQLNGVESAEQKFTVDPSVQQKLETRVQESSSFLSKINIMPVTEQIGAKLGLGVSSPIASTTNTTTTDRATKDPSDLAEDLYSCTQTNSDTHLTYAKLDAWAKFPDFQTRFRDAVVKRQALDRIMIGFNGVSRAATSNAGANPLLQDVNIGWLQKYRTNAPARVLTDGASVGANAIHIGGATPDYANLDALVMDAVSSLVEPWFRDDPELVCIVGADLLHDKYFPIVNAANPPTEKIAADLIISQKRLGGRQAVQAPFMKAGAIFITRLDNLSVYWQEGSRRRTVTDNAKRDRIENWESWNEAFVVEDYGCGCLIENIVIG